MYVSDMSFCKCKVECHCGEDDVYEWVWDEKHTTHTVTLSNNNLEVQFNNGYSRGTAVARAKESLEKGRHHYWEVKMLTAIYGTDVMVGVGTDKVDINHTVDTFCSLLGSNEESFGYSYRGHIHYGGNKYEHGKSFGQGSLVGVHVDSWKGTLQFFLNRNPVGVPFSGLRGITLYPMVCSTLANSGMRLTYSCSMPASLQAECLAVLKPLHKNYLSTIFPGLKHLCTSIFTDILRKNSDNEKNEEDDLAYPAECMILDDYDFVLVGLNRKKRKHGTDQQI